jgi:hypothetical protein
LEVEGGRKGGCFCGEKHEEEEEKKEEEEEDSMQHARHKLKFPCHHGGTWTLIYVNHQPPAECAPHQCHVSLGCVSVLGVCCCCCCRPLPVRGGC